MADYFWSRVPGRFVDKTSGKVCAGASFTGTTREWYETLIEVMNDVQRVALEENGQSPIPRVKWVSDPDVCAIAACSVLVHADDRDEDIGILGAPMRFVLRYSGRIPIQSSQGLFGTGVIELIHERPELMEHDGQVLSDLHLGSVRVLDLHRP